MTDQTRNEIIEAEIEAAGAHALAHFDGLAAAFHESADDYATATAARVLRDSAYSCKRCQHVFAEGDVVFRRRISDGPGSGSWNFIAYCLDCASAHWHPSWMEHRSEPVECAGGCGVLVTSAYWKAPKTCSRRCSEIAARTRRAVAHDERECAECGEPFVPTRRDARYHSSACRQKAYRGRVKT